MLTASSSQAMIDNSPGRSICPSMYVSTISITAKPTVPTNNMSSGSTEAENSGPYRNGINQGLTAAKGIAIANNSISVLRVTLAVSRADSSGSNWAIFAVEDDFTTLRGIHSFSASDVERE